MSKAKASTQFICFLFAVLIGEWLNGNALAVARHRQEAPLLVASQRVEREWEGDQPHLYRLHLEAGQYVSLRLDVLSGKFYYKAELLTPDGKRIEGTDHCNEAPGQDFPALLTIAPRTGDYTVEVSVARSVRVSTAQARYVLTVTALRSPNEQDKDYVEAWRSFMEAQRNHGLDTSDGVAKAKTLYLKARALFHQLGDAQLERKVLVVLADVHNTQGEYEQAADISRQAVALSRTMRNSGGEADALMYLGEAFIHLSDYAQAREAFQQALPLWRSQGNDSTWGVGWTLHSLATCYYLLGERRKAIEFGEAAFKTYQSVDYRPREGYRGSGGSATNLGRAYLALGEIREAMKWLDIGLENWKKAEEVWGEARVYYYLGDYYSSLGDLQASKENYELALSKWRISNDPNDIGNVLQSLGGLALKSRDYISALRYLNETLDIRVKHKQRRGQAETLTLLGRYYAATGATSKAIEYYNQALELCREISARSSEASVLGDLGAAHYALGDKPQARELLQQALQLHRIVQAPEGEAQTLYWLARTERDLGLPAEARHSIEAAITVSESIRASVISQDLRTSYLASVSDYYEFYLDLLMQLHRTHHASGYNHQALQISERARARSLIELLAESRADIRQGVDPALLERESELQQHLNGKSEFQLRLLSSKHTPEQAAAIAAEIEEIINQLQTTRARIKTLSPRYAALTQPQPLNAEQIQQELLDADTLLLEYDLGEERSYLWAVTANTLTSYELPGRAEIETKARRAYELLTARNRNVSGEPVEQKKLRIAQADAQFPQAAAELSQMLLAPAATMLNRKRILIVADGALQFIPFGVLPDPAVNGSAARPRHSIQQPLIVTHEFVSLPSASTLAVLRRETAHRPLAPKSVAVLADPVFDQDDDRLTARRTLDSRNTAKAATPEALRDLQRAAAGLENGELRFPRLIYTRWEAEKIAALSPAGTSFKALDFSASHATATNANLGQYRILHFASHGFINNAHPELSGLVLSLVDERGQWQDGFLRAHEIYNLKLPVELVMLSACRTGLGKEIKGEGLINLTRGFMYAGALRVGVSLWAVEDKAAAELMIKFYRRMLGLQRMTPAAALRAAQVEMLRDHRYAQPYFWAGFVLQGEWR